MTARYYRALAGGALGFEKAREFRSWLGEAGEEAFSVYDHPVVRIYRKTPGYSRARAEALLGNVQWHNVVAVSAREAARAPTGLMLPEGRGLQEAVSGTWDELFPAGAPGARFPLAVWLAAVFLLGWAAAPYLYLACPGFADRGYGFAKTLGILLTAWLAWFGAAAGMTRFTRPWIWAAAALIIAGAAAICAAQRREMRAFLAERWKLLLAVEAVFLCAFAIMAAARMGNLDLWHPSFGGEKPMDFAYLAATVRSDRFPPFNPWFAGGFINYYYFGFVMVAALLKGCAIPPEVGYNLALPTLFALAAAGLYSLTHALLGPRWTPRRRAIVALLGPWFVLVLGNLKQIAIAAANWSKTGAPLSTWYFDASRAIRVAPGEPPVITEFPFFTYLYGDLHAHAMALPLFVLALGVSAALALAPAGAKRSRYAALALAALACGALWAANTWDLPVAAAALGAALWIARAPASRSAAEWAGALAAGYLAFLPFHRWYAPAYGWFALWRGSRTGSVDYLVVYGVFVFALALGLASIAPPRWRKALFGAALLAVWLALDAPAWPIPAALLCFAAARCRQAKEGERFALALGAAGLCLTLAVEFVVLQSDVGRMNTVFKFGFEAWTLLGVAAAVWAPRWFAEAPTPLARRAAATALAVLMAAAMAYPLTAPAFRSRDRFDAAIPPSWNGMDFLATARHTQCGQEFRLAGDLQAIRWLRANVAGAPVIAESNTDPVEYSWGGRISTYAGLPTIVGWNWHVRQQMGPQDAGRVARRIADVQELYDTPDAARAWKILRKYEAGFVMVGALERACQGRAGIEKFETGAGRYWDVAFTAGETRIFRVRARGD
jgi:YYY domain-containing protein